MNDKQLLLWCFQVGDTIVANVKAGKISNEEGIASFTRMHDDALHLVNLPASEREEAIRQMASDIEKNGV